MSFIKVNPAQLEHAHTQIRSISTTIDTQLDTLKAMLQRIQWEGRDRQAYQEQQLKWDNALRDLNAVLNEIGGAVGIARENYITTETNNAQMWGA